MNYAEMRGLLVIAAAPVIDAPLAICVTARGHQTTAVKTVVARRRNALRAQAIEGAAPLDSHDSDDNRP